MSINTIETHVLEMIGESTTSPDVFTDTDAGMEPIRDSINDAIEEISMLTGSYKLQYHVPLIQDQGFYRLRLTNGSIGWITDVFQVNRKYQLSQTDEWKLTNDNPRWMVNNGDPCEYLQIGNDVLGVVPRPSGTSDVLEVTMVAIPARYSSGADRLKLRDAFKWAAVHYAVSEYWASRGDAFSAMDHYKKYVQLLGIQSLYPQSAERVPYYKTAKQ